MGFSLKFHYCFVCVILLLPALGYSEYYFIKSRASYYGTADGLGTPSGACGFGKYGRTMDHGNVAAVSSRLYKNGAGCGACYQVWCTNPQLCSADGVNLVVTDYGEGDRTDFILSLKAYKNMAKPNKTNELLAYGVVEVEYTRFPCRYEGHKLTFMVNHHSSNPYYLAIVFLYQPDEYDIIAVDVSQKDHKAWIGMRRAYGAVFDIANPPTGPLSLRFLVQASSGWTWYKEAHIPSDWEAGSIFRIY